jgi:hypothetical protein
MVKRKEAVLRGLRFIYRNCLEGDNFEDWGGDYLWCFHSIASTSADGELRALAREMGAALAMQWQREQQALPELADAGEVGYYMSMIDVSSRLGIDNHQLGEHVRQGSRRFTARDYLGFDPLREAPPAGARSRYDDHTTLWVAKESRATVKMSTAMAAAGAALMTAELMP